MMRIILFQIIAIVVGVLLFKFFKGKTSGDSSYLSDGADSKSSSTGSNTNKKEYVRQQIINKGGLCKFAIYYDTSGYNYGWKGVDYWNNGCSLKKVEGEWGYTCFETPEGKVYRIQTTSPDKEKIYFFE